MYSKLQLAKKYLHYLFTASNGSGHGIHSPFVYDFIKNVLRDKEQYACYKPIELVRKKLYENEQVIEVQDQGAGSAVIKTTRRAVKDIAHTSLKSKRYAQLLFRIAKRYSPRTIIELGTSLGITTSYLASTSPPVTVYTLEGATTIASIASAIFIEQGFNNIVLTTGDFDSTMPAILSRIQEVDMAFIDGNHRKEPTLRYFNQLKAYSTNSTIMIFDDIHWSSEMEEAWSLIKADPAVTLSIDLFFLGLIFFRKDFKSTQHFTIRF